MKRDNVHIGLIILFFTISLVHIIGILIKNPGLTYVTKPCIIPILLLIYLVKKEKINYWYIVGLILCFLGDVLLIFEGELFFIMGLVSFLIAHLIYSKIVYKLLAKIDSNTLIKAAIPFVTLYVILLTILYPYLGPLFYPVVFYGVVISILGTLCFYYYLFSKTINAYFWFLGASFFIISDSILAFNKFYSPNIYLGVFVMITYVLAQYLICKAMLVEQKT